MRAKTITTTLAALAVLVVLALPASAGAAKTVHRPAQVSAYLLGNGTHGFHFVLLAVGKGEVMVTLKELKGEGEEDVSYVAFHHHPSHSLDNGRLDLKIGKLGHLRGRFVATSTKVQKLEDECTGEPTKVEDGYFAGSFVFHGERGYTTIEAPRMTGAITREGATDCRISAPAGGHHPHNSKVAEEMVEKAEEDEFRLLAGDSRRRLVLQATREHAPPETDGPAATTFEVTAAGGKAGRFTISRSASILDTHQDAASTFVIPNLAEPLAGATLEPPAPFSGSATFQLEGPKKATWTGDLAVELPGAGKVPLTGKKIHAGACRGRTNCTKTLPKSLQPLLEGGGRFDGSSYVGGATGS